MSFVIYFFGSSLAFLTGVALVLIGVVMSPWRRRLGAFLALLGLTFIALSATPLPYWFYAVAGVVSATWLVLECLRRKTSPLVLSAARNMVAILWLIAVLIDLPYQFTSHVEVTGRPALWIVGDSVTAGLGDRTETWPAILSRTRDMEVHDLSQMGATVGSALRRLEKEPLGDGIILLEIGGNDLLGTTAAADFELNLKALLERVCKPGRTVLMFELPLPPLRNDYGLIQRRLAAEYAVVLIPKRVLVGVLTAADATADGIHLTQTGHQIMAEVVGNLVRPRGVP